jgi:glycosyltransferase involved in cell wall biosynthesis
MEADLMEPRDITVILPFYRNPGMLTLQLERIASYPKKIRDHFRLIVVDDGSPEEKAVAPETPPPFPLQMFRIDVDVRWNWLAARNIGHKHATTQWVLFTDIDHLIPERTAQFLVEEELDRDIIYRFSRRNYPGGEIYHPHPNSWLMTRKMFDKTGGYDERFSGHYGTDGMFRDRCAAAADKVILLKRHLERVDRKDVPDASTRHYERKADVDKAGVPRIRAEIEASGDLKPHRLTFPYHEFYKHPA